MKYLFTAVFSLFAIFSFSQETVFHNVLFDVDKHNVKKSEQLKLLEFIDGIDSLEILSIELKGHTDSDAGDDYNLKLSERRVATVNTILKDKVEIEPSISYFGESKPLNNNQSDLQKEKNRRVEVIVKYKAAPKVHERNISELYDITCKKLDEYCIDPNKDTTLILEQGTIITIKANTFDVRSGCVTIKTKEVYKNSEMILENLSTSSNGAQLETGGMIYVEANDGNGRELKAQKSLTFLMPTTNPQDDMGLFYGDMHDDGVNWRSTNTSMGVLNSGFWMGCYGGYRIRCRFFFCRIWRLGKGIRGIFNESQRRANREFRASIGTFQPTFASSSRYLGNSRYDCDSLQKLLNLYDVNNYNDLVFAMNKELMDSLGLNTIEELQEELEKQRVRNTEMEIESGESDAQKVSYYAFNSARLGWMNCDSFTRDKPLISMRTGVARSSSIDAKLVFKRFRSVMPSNNNASQYEFQKIKKGEPVYYIVMKYTDDGIFLSLSETETDKKAPKVNFEKVSLEELKERMAVLDY